MADGTVGNVRVGIVGAIYRGAPGSPLPSDAATATDDWLTNNGYQKAGYVSTDGVTQTINAATTSIRAWGGDEVRVIQTEHGLRYGVTLLEHNEVALQAYYGEQATATYVEINGEQLPVTPWVFVVRDGSKRIVIAIPLGQVVERAEVAYNGQNAVGLGITIACYPDSAGAKAYLHLGDVVVAAPTVTGITPSSGGTAGGEVVEITGTGFVDLREVLFGETRALAAQAQSATSIIAVTPAHAAAVVDVIVKTAAGTSATGPDTEFEFTDES